MSSTRAAEAPPAVARRRASRAPAGVGGGLPSYLVPTLVRELVRRLGADPGRAGLRRTPERVDESLRSQTREHASSPREVIGDALFDEHHHNMLIVKDIEMYSLCEHHILPFFGQVHIAYIPDGQIPSLSKMVRLVELYDRRLQVQERLTEEAAGSFWEVVKPQGVGVVVEAYHPCMTMRGVQKQNSFKITAAMRGAFLEDARTRDEFLRLCEADRIPVG